MEGNWVTPKIPIYLLKMLGKGVASKNKKRKIDLGKLVEDDIDPCRPSSAGLFEEFSSEIWIIQDLVSKLPIWTMSFL